MKKKNKLSSGDKYMIGFALLFLSLCWLTTKPIDASFQRSIIHVVGYTVFTLTGIIFMAISSD